MSVVPNQDVLDRIERIEWERSKPNKVEFYFKDQQERPSSTHHLLSPQQEQFALNLAEVLAEYIAGLLNLPSNA